MMVRHCLADRADNRVEIRLLRIAAQFLDDHELLAVAPIDAERGAMADAQCSVRVLYGPLDVLWVMVAPVQDHQILQASGDEQLSIVQEPEIPGTQERQLAPIAEGRAEGCLGRLRLFPVTATDRGAGHEDLTHPVGGEDLPGGGIDDRQLRTGQGNAAANQGARILSARANRRDEAFAERFGAQCQKAGLGAVALAGDGESRLGESIRRRKGRARKSKWRECVEEARDGCRVDRLCAAARVPHAAEVGRPAGLRC